MNKKTVTREKKVRSLKRHLISLVLSLASLSILLIPPHIFWIAGLLSFIIPFVILYNIGFSIYFLIKAFPKALYYLIPLIFGIPVIKSSVSLFGKCEEDAGSFKVLSYNLQFLDYYQKYAKDNRYELYINGIKTFLKSSDADVYCFQEFYNEADELDYLNTLLPGYHSYFSSDSSSLYSSRRGVAIFSKLPILKKGKIDFGTGNHNRGIFVEVKINDDTVKIINVHLQSMSLKRLNPKYKEVKSYNKTFLEIVKRLKNGFVDQSYQLNQMVSFLKETPKKTILTGDFNQPPFSNLYMRLNRMMHNSFEKAGKGFGFTYNGNTLFFLRIDYQFFSKDIDIHCFKTHNQINFSDHYPVEGIYSISKE